MSPKPVRIDSPEFAQSSNLVQIAQALSFASRKHMNQRRKDSAQSPYIKHPIDLFGVLVNEAGIADPVILCAALLHDTIEDTDATEAELRSCFGDEIASVVAEVTDDKAISDKALRRRIRIELAPKMSQRAKLVKLADLISNLRDHNGPDRPSWSRERRRDYFLWGRQVGLGCQVASQHLFALLELEIAKGLSDIQDRERERGKS